MGLILYDWCPYKEEKNGIQRQTYTGKCNVKTGGMLPQAKDCRKPPAAGSGEEGFIPRAFRESMALLSDTLSQTPGLQNHEPINLCYLSHPVCGPLLWQLTKETNTKPNHHKQQPFIKHKLWVRQVLGSREKQRHHLVSLCVDMHKYMLCTDFAGMRV